MAKSNLLKELYESKFLATYYDGNWYPWADFELIPIDEYAKSRCPKCNVAFKEVELFTSTINCCPKCGRKSDDDKNK